MIVGFAFDSVVGTVVVMIELIVIVGMEVVAVGLLNVAIIFKLLLQIFKYVSNKNKTDLYPQTWMTSH